MTETTTTYYVEMIDKPWEGVGGDWLRMTPGGRSTEGEATAERRQLAADYPNRRTRVVRETTTVEVVGEWSAGRTRLAPDVEAVACAECGHLHYLGDQLGYCRCPIEGCGCLGQDDAGRPIATGSRS